MVLLADAVQDLPPHWRLLLECPLLRLGRRIDAVLLTDRAIVVLEFKIGGTRFHQADVEQTEDHALDLRDFHAGSRNQTIIPIPIASNAPVRPQQLPLFIDLVSAVIKTNARHFKETVATCLTRIPPPRVAVAIDDWETAAYQPVPTIVDAARLLFARHGIGEITAARADVANLTTTMAAIRRTAHTARTERRHVILFVTGIPGAGKSPCGLNAVFGEGSASAFLTGNLPLVHVMRAALERDARDQGRGLRQARQETESAIQPLMGFLRDNPPRESPPHEHVIVCDEAQRAWDAEFGRGKFGHPRSEAAMFLDIMARHRAWAVIIALVGSGQEINTGEAGLAIADFLAACGARPLPPPGHGHPPGLANPADMS